MNEIAATRARKRCAVYCRVSSDERLDQEFNSIDAQKEAGHAYIASQRAEGWIPVTDDYDDPGFSGGNTDRPALKRLLADIEWVARGDTPTGRRVLVASGPFRPGPFMGLAEASGLRLICDNDWRDIRDLYGAGDALINPTPMDTFGLAVLEAMAMGLPAITTRYAGVSELLRDGEDAFILKEPWDTEAIAGMADRIADDAFRERMSSAASALASGLSWERPAVDHLSIYESAMRSKVSGGA